MSLVATGSLFAHITAFDWLLLVAAGFLAGFGKTAIGGLGLISVALFAAVLPSRESTATLLLLLLVGDVVAVRSYRAHADWKVLVRLLPSVCVGISVGAVFVWLVSNVELRRTIGIVILLLVGVHIWRRRYLPEDGAPVVMPGRWVSVAAGGAAGFTSMVANAGGAVMSIYLLAAGLGVLGFLGTGAWFFFLVNLIKVPFSVALGLFTVRGLALALVLAPVVLLGAWAGLRVVSHLNRKLFERLVLAGSTLAAVNLLR